GARRQSPGFGLRSSPVSRAFQGQGHTEGSFTWLAGDCQISIMRLRDPVGDTQAETGAWRLMLHRRASVKSFENPPSLLDRYPLAPIGDIKSHVAVHTF